MGSSAIASRPARTQASECESAASLVIQAKHESAVFVIVDYCLAPVRMGEVDEHALDIAPFQVRLARDVVPKHDAISRVPVVETRVAEVQRPLTASRRHYPLIGIAVIGFIRKPEYP